MKFDGTSVIGTVDFVAGQSSLNPGDAIVGSRALGSCSFTALVGGSVTVEGTVAGSELEMSGAWGYLGYAGSWRAGRVFDTAVGVGTATTDPTAAGVSPADPIATTVVSPNPGSIAIDEAISTGGSVGGYSVNSVIVRITAPAATAADPLFLTFDLDASVVGPDPSALRGFRNGVPIDSFCSPPNTLPISPDPCIWSYGFIGDDLRVTIATSQASLWFFGVAKSDEPRVVTDKLLSAKLGQSYTKVLVAANTEGRVKWKKLSKLPKGLKLAAKTGVISGTPKKVSGTFVIRVALIDKVKAKGSPAVTTRVERNLVLTVRP
jgi:hypothetical protein